MTLACYVKFFGMAFTSAGSEWNVGRPVREVPASMLAPKLALTAVALVQGLFPALSVGLVLTALGRSEGFFLAGAVAASGAAGHGLAPGRSGCPAFGAAAAPLVGPARPRPGPGPRGAAPEVGRLEGCRSPDLALRLPGPGQRQPVHGPGHVRGPAGPVQVRRRKERQVGRFVMDAIARIETELRGRFGADLEGTESPNADPALRRRRPPGPAGRFERPHRARRPLHGRHRLPTRSPATGRSGSSIPSPSTPTTSRWFSGPRPRPRTRPSTRSPPTFPTPAGPSASTRTCSA
ncbi:MAG: hypothetical protein M0C28_12745 [Candidatus Moduliflexus flocculans]|nr:hypothetical protein [Candidatus Moduliflexus flocculans]